MLARDGTGALLGDAYARLRPLEIQSASALQARDASLRARLANANFRLRMAIEAEAYEEAALWRDEIRRLGGVIAVT